MKAIKRFTRSELQSCDAETITNDFAVGSRVRTLSLLLWMIQIARSLSKSIFLKMHQNTSTKP